MRMAADCAVTNMQLYFDFWYFWILLAINIGLRDYDNFVATNMALL
jgi:hypothetical protein